MLFLINNFFNMPANATKGLPVVLRLIPLCCLALTISSVGCNKDSAQWKVAAASIETKNANPDGAIELLQTALRMDPESNDIKIRLANLLADNDQGDLGLTLCDEILEDNPCDKHACETRARCLQSLGRFGEALADYQNCCADSIDKNCNELNGLAYYRALAGFELDKALRQINSGISRYEQNATVTAGFPLQVRSIVTAGLVSRHTDDGHLLIIDLLDEFIFNEQQAWVEKNKKLKKLYDLHEQANQENPSDETDDQRADRQKAEEREAVGKLKLESANLALLLATRSLIFEDQGQTELADLDRLWIERIGFQQKNVYSNLPSDDECLTTLAAGQAMLDTRGFILTQMPWRPTWHDSNGITVRVAEQNNGITYGSYNSALRDLDIAVAASETRLLALSSDLVNRIDFRQKSEDMNAVKAMEARMVAVLRNHRRQAHLKAKQFEAAEQDLLRIKELGYEAGPSLF